MKNLKWMCTGYLLIITTVILMAQQKPVYEKEGRGTRVTHFYENGLIKETGTYDSKGQLNGDWVQYNPDGSISFQAYFENGEKEGRWFRWENEGQTMYEITYADNKLVNVQKWSLEQRNMLAEN